MLSWLGEVSNALYAHRFARHLSPKDKLHLYDNELTGTLPSEIDLLSASLGESTWFESYVIYLQTRTLYPHSFLQIGCGFMTIN